MNGTERILRQKYCPETLTEAAPAQTVQKARACDFSYYPHGSTFPDLASLVQKAREVQKARGDNQQLFVHMLQLMTAQHYGLGA